MRRAAAARKSTSTEARSRVPSCRAPMRAARAQIGGRRRSGILSPNRRRAVARIFALMAVFRSGARRQRPHGGNDARIPDPPHSSRRQRGRRPCRNCAAARPRAGAAREAAHRPRAADLVGPDLRRAGEGLLREGQSRCRGEVFRRRRARDPGADRGRTRCHRVDAQCRAVQRGQQGRALQADPRSRIGKAGLRLDDDRGLERHGQRRHDGGRTRWRC